MRKLNKEKRPSGQVVKANKKAIVISTLLALMGVTVAVVFYQYTYSAKLEQELNNKQYQLEERIKEVETQRQQIINQDNEKSKLEQERQNLEQQKQELEKQLQAKAEKARVAQIQAAQAASAPKAVSYTATAQTTNISDAKAFIYQKESGNNPAAVNSIGCRGLGQACPGSKLPCSNSDYACQDAWFTNYAMQRYGSWENAKAFWILNHWW